MDPALALAQVRRRLTEGVPQGHSDDDGVRRQWWAALATLQEDFLLPALETPSDENSRCGLWLAAPLPALYEPALLQQLQGWVWAPEQLEGLLTPPALLPAGRRPTSTARPGAADSVAPQLQRLPLEPEDGTDPLLVVITPALQVALCLDGPAGQRRLVVRFEPAVLSRVLALVHARLSADAGDAAQALRLALQQLGSLHSDPELGLRFWPRLAERLSAIAPSVTLQPQHPRRSNSSGAGEASAELALLEALTHEVRTPLATIRTLIRSLLRRRDLGDVVRQRLEQIDGECSEQIDRFGLIFLAAELQRQPGAGDVRKEGQVTDGAGESHGSTSRDPSVADQLARTDLSELLRQLEPLWQRQLARRQLTLQLQISANLPPVLSDPARLEMMLGGLIDRFSRGLPPGSGVSLSLQPAGSRLKLQLRSGDSGAAQRWNRETPGRRHSVGPVLSWDPNTGSLQLSRQATQQLFRRLGGRLTERGDNGLTVFFPVC
jgi:signal transduction histidine kinase